MSVSIVSGGWIGGVSPFDQTPLEKVAVSAGAEIAATVAQARAAQTEWQACSIPERCKVLARTGRHLLSHASELARVLHTELGKPLTETYTVDLGSAPEVFSYYTRNAARLLRSENIPFNPVMFPGKRARVEHLPHGVVALLAPWNYPVSIPLHNIVPALIAGNAVVLKPSEYAARTGALLYSLLAECLPAGLIGLVQGDRVAGEALIRAGVDHVIFVGGASGGRAVARVASDYLIPVSLELGGNDAAIVLADADLDRAANGIAWAGFLNAGQSCAGVERVYVVEAVAEGFTRRLVQIAAALRLGDDATSPGEVDIGPVSTPAQLEIIRAQVNQALEAGARLHSPGPASALPPGRFYSPTVLTGVDSTMRVMQEETFGPVVAVQVVPDEATAIRQANTGPYGLTGSVWTRDLARGERVAASLKVGVATVNNHMFSGAAPQAPWTGRANSGYGVQNGRLALLSLTRPRLLAVDAHNTPRELWWLPYDRHLFDLAQGMLTVRAGLRVTGLRRFGPAYLRMLRGVLARWRWQRRR